MPWTTPGSVEAPDWPELGSELMATSMSSAGITLPSPGAAPVTSPAPPTMPAGFGDEALRSRFKDGNALHMMRHRKHITQS
jgi:hypothetical protein